MAIYENTNNLSMKAWSYNNPIVIIVAVMLVDLATQSSFRSKFINEFAKGSFTCLLFHSWFFKFLEIEKAVGDGLVVLILHQFVTGIVLFFCSYIAHKIWTFLWSGLLKITKAEIPFSKLDRLLFWDLQT